MAAGTPTLQVPRWIQLVLLPLVLIAAWVLAGAVRHALLIFLVSGIIALLLSPLVHGLTQMRLPRGAAVALVYLSFATLLVAGTALLGTLAVSQAQSISRQVQDEFTVNPATGRAPADTKVDDLQRWLDTHGLARVHVRDLGSQIVSNLEHRKLSSYTNTVVNVTETVATTIVTGLFNLVLIVVVSVYMLLDAPRFSRVLNRMFPPGPDGKELGASVQRGLISYVRGQLLVSLIIGASAGLGMALLGVLGIWPDATKWAFFFGLFAAITEFIPYVGPILGAIPPVVLALLHSPITAVWVIIVFVLIHQVEGHVVVPRVFGSALGAHPLLIIFGLLAGADLYGIPGVFLALPLIAIGREVYLFFRPRIQFEPWSSGTLAGTGLQLSLPVHVPPSEEAPGDEPPPGEATEPLPGPARTR
jgi:predicted PurR-regulated permease PerM